MFDRTGNERFGAVLCSNTRENSREIRVFMIIYRVDTHSFSPGKGKKKSVDSARIELGPIFESIYQCTNHSATKDATARQFHHKFMDLTTVVLVY